jgi:glycosyltransferase involved in cell wall biosynthesis
MAFADSADLDLTAARAPVDVRARRKVRVLFINDTARNGGPGRSLYYILKFLDTDVIHRAVVLPRAGVISELYESEKVTDELFFEHHLVENPIEPFSRSMEREDFEASLAMKGLRLLGNVYKGGSAMARLTRLIQRGRYDLIYCNGTNADFAGGGLAFTSGVPALWHVRYTSLPALARPLHDRLAASDGVARIVCVSNAAAGLFPHCMDKVRVIHNALDIDEFGADNVTPALRTELGLEKDAIVFGSQGRILPRKGYVEMTRAASIALSRMTDEEKTRVHFVVLGDTPQDIGPDHLAECRALVKSLGIEKSFTYTGFRKDVKPYVTDFDVAVVPSVYPDPLPRAVIESMALGKAVIAFDVGGVAEMMRDGATGTLVRGVPPDVMGLAEQFLRYARDPELRERQGRAGRRRIEQEYDARRQARRIQNEIVHAAKLAEAPETP